MKVDVLIAGPVSYFGDDVATACGACGVRLFKRPHAPEASRVSCLPCATTEVKEGEPFEIVTSPLALRDALEYLTAAAAAQGQADRGGH